MYIIRHKTNKTYTYQRPTLAAILTLRQRVGGDTSWSKPEEIDDPEPRPKTQQAPSGSEDDASRATMRALLAQQDRDAENGNEEGDEEEGDDEEGEN